MPRQQICTVGRTVDVSPSTDRQLHRLAAFHETTVPEFIRRAIQEAYGPPSDEDRQPGLLDPPGKAARGGRR